jgi:hypothetical protein
MSYNYPAAGARICSRTAQEQNGPPVSVEVSTETGGRVLRPVSSLRAYGYGTVTSTSVRPIRPLSPPGYRFRFQPGRQGRPAHGNGPHTTDRSRCRRRIHAQAATGRQRNGPGVHVISESPPGLPAT